MGEQSGAPSRGTGGPIFESRLTSMDFLAALSIHFFMFAELAKCFAKKYSSLLANFRTLKGNWVVRTGRKSAREWSLQPWISK